MLSEGLEDGGQSRGSVTKSSHRRTRSHTSSFGGRAFGVKYNKKRAADQDEDSECSVIEIADGMQNKSKSNNNSPTRPCNPQVAKQVTHFLFQNADLFLKCLRDLGADV